MAHLDLPTSRVDDSLRRYVFFDAEPYRLKGGVRSEFIFALSFGRRWRDGLEIRAGRGDECASLADPLTAEKLGQRYKLF